MKEIELKKVSNARIGRVNTCGAHLEAHEYDTIYFLASYGFDIEIIKPSNTPKTSNPDFLIKGAIWEAKSPNGSGSSTIARQFHKAGKQADRLVLDLRRIRLSVDISEKEAKKRFASSRNIKRLLLITKDNRLLDIRK
ncbi:hypothetical protein IKG28_00890 [Candidatus Saccharibacteria bacterium]|nr:hypothetical protein [Candidatus Saccharibacteria bacterium]